MPEALFFVFGLLSVFYGLYLLFSEIRFHMRFRKEMQRQFKYRPAVSVIAPVRSPEQRLEENVRGLLEQDYSQGMVEYIFALDSKDDPAYALLQKMKTRNREKSIKIVFAKPLPKCSRKVAAMVAALPHARNEVLVFADTDGRPRREWLRSLVGRLERAGVSSGFRFYLPEGTWRSYLRSSWNNIGMSQIFSSYIFAWAGSMAIRKKDFYKARVPEHWKKSLADDLIFSERAKKIGLTIEYEPRCVLLTRDSFTPRQFMEFASRQMTILRNYRPRLLLLALIGIGALPFFVLLGVAALVFGFHLPAALLLSGGLLYTVKEAVRFCSYRRNLKISGSIAKYALAGFAAAWLFAYNCLAAVRRNTIKWRGTTYRINGPYDIEVLGS